MKKQINILKCLLSIASMIFTSNFLFAQSWQSASPDTLFCVDNEEDTVNIRVGIGTTHPQEKLHVIGNIKVEGTLKADTIRASRILAPDSVIYIGDSTNVKVGIGTNSPTERLQVLGNIKVQDGAVITDTLRVSRIVSLDSLIRFGDSTFMVNPGANSIYADNGDLKIQADPAISGTTYNTILNANGNTGNVGIGTPTPSFKFHVYGDGGILSTGNTLEAVKK